MIIEDKVTKYDQCTSCHTKEDIKVFLVGYENNNYAIQLVLCEKCANELANKFKVNDNV